MNANTPNTQSSGPSVGHSSSGQPSSNVASKASVQSLRQTARNAGEALKNSVSDALDRGKAGIADSAYAAGDSLSEDLTHLRADMAKMQETLSKFVSEVGGEAAQTMSTVGHAVANQVGSAASSLAEASADVASSATDQVKTFASELEGMARRNPLGTLAGTLVVGLIVGMMVRGRI